MGKNKALIFAAGNGTRMKHVVPKQFIKLNGLPVIFHTILKFENNNLIDEIYVVIKKGYKESLEEYLSKYNLKKKITVLEPKKDDTGLDSTYYGIIEASKNMDPDDIILIHDGVRPVISDELINENIKVCREKGNAISVSTLFESPVEIDEDGKIKKVLERKMYRLTKAPQTFFLKDILVAHEKIRKEFGNYTNFTDSSAIMRYLGNELNTVESSNSNIKITEKDDVFKVLGLLDEEKYKDVFDIDIE